MSHRQHHFVPRFLLEQWCSGDLGKLVSFRYANGRLIHSPCSPKAVGKLQDLYSIQRSAGEPNVVVEKDFFGPQVDDPAAVVHQKMLAQGVSCLTIEDKKKWSPFLISLMLRVPRMVKRIRERGREVLGAGLDETPDEYAEVRGDNPAPTLRKWVEATNPDILDDLGIMTLPHLVFSERLNLPVLNVTWGIRSVEPARHNLLIGDHPLILVGAFEREFLLAIPIAPRKLFFAYNDPASFGKMLEFGVDELVKRANVSTVEAAERYVFATSASQESFVKKYLRKPSQT